MRSKYGLNEFGKTAVSPKYSDFYGLCKNGVTSSFNTRDQSVEDIGEMQRAATLGEES
jgi:hypothetical protein